MNMARPHFSCDNIFVWKSLEQFANKCVPIWCVMSVGSVLAWMWAAGLVESLRNRDIVKSMPMESRIDCVNFRLVFGSPVSSLEKDCNQTRPRPQKTGPMVSVF
jgi:hypothetical protein